MLLSGAAVAQEAPSASYKLAQAKETKTLTLDQVLNQARERNFSVQDAQSLVTQADGVYTQALALVLPKLQLSGDYRALSSSPGVGIGLKLHLPILNIAGIFSVKAERKNLDAAQLTEQRQKTLTKRDVRIAYAQVLSAQRVLGLRQNQVQNWRTQLDSLQRKLAMGKTRILDVRRMEIELLKAENRVAEQRITVENALAGLGLLIGEKHRFEIVESPVSELREVEQSEDDLVAYALAYRSDLKAQKLRELGAGAALDASLLSYVPALQLSSTLETTTEIIAQRKEVFNASGIVGLSMPLFDSAIWGRRRELSGRLQQQKVATKRLQHTIDLEVRGAFADFKQKKASLELVHKAEKLAGRALKSAKHLFDAGRVSGLELELATKELFSAQIEGQQADLEAQISYLKLMAAIEQG